MKKKHSWRRNITEVARTGGLLIKRKNLEEGKVILRKSETLAGRRVREAKTKRGP